MIKIINPYYTIFKENNWFYDSENRCICYSDEDITVSPVKLNIPFKTDKEYNKKLLMYLDKFLQVIMRQIDICKINKIVYSFDENQKTPLNINIIVSINNNCIHITHQ